LNALRRTVKQAARRTLKRFEITVDSIQLLKYSLINDGHHGGQQSKNKI